MFLVFNEFLDRIFRRLFFHPRRLQRVVERLLGGTRIGTGGFQFFDHLAPGFLDRFAGFTRAVQFRFGGVFCGFQCRFLDFLDRVARGRCGFALRIEYFFPRLHDFTERLRQFLLPRWVVGAVLDGSDNLLGNVERTITHGTVNFTLDGAALVRVGAAFGHANDLRRYRDHHQQQERGKSQQDHRPPGSAVNEIAKSLEHDHSEMSASVYVSGPQSRGDITRPNPMTT